MIVDVLYDLELFVLPSLHDSLLLSIECSYADCVSSPDIYLL